MELRNMLWSYGTCSGAYEIPSEAKYHYDLRDIQNPF